MTSWRRRLDGAGGTPARLSRGVLWTGGGSAANECWNVWTKGLAQLTRWSYLDGGANGGAARSVTGRDTGGSTRLGTRSTTRPGLVTFQARESARDQARDFSPDHSPERAREFLRRRFSLFGVCRATNDRGDWRKPSGQRCVGRPVPAPHDLVQMVGLVRDDLLRALCWQLGPATLRAT